MPIPHSRVELAQAKALGHAIRKNNLNEVKHLLADGVLQLSNYVDMDTELTALQMAIVRGRKEIIEYLLENGANANAIDLDGKTALMVAAQMGNIDAMRVLLQSPGTEISLKDFKGQNVVYHSLMGETDRYNETIRLAVEAGADVNLKLSSGFTLLDEACKDVTREVRALTLLGNGADPNIVHGETGATALHFAAASGSSQVIAAILKTGVDPMLRDLQGRTAAHYAAANSQVLPLLELSSFGAKFNVQDVDGNTPLHDAARTFENSTNVIKFLLQRGCNWNTPNNNKHKVKMILKAFGVHMNQKAFRKNKKYFKKHQNRPKFASDLMLYDYIQSNLDDLMMEFLALDEENTGTIPVATYVKVIQARTKIPKEHLFGSGHLQNYRLLLTGRKLVPKAYRFNKFQLNTVVDKKRKKPKGKKWSLPIPQIFQPPELTLDEKLELRNEQRKKNKKKKNKKNKPPVGKFKDVPLTIMVQEPQPTIDPTRNYGNTGLAQSITDDSAWYMAPKKPKLLDFHVAVHQKDKKAILTALDLLDPKATRTLMINRQVKKIELPNGIDTKDRWYRTPLMIACQKGDLSFVKFIVSLGPNLKALDNYMWSALHHAVYNGHLDIVKYLIEELRFPVNQQTMNKCTPLMKAIEKNDLPIVQYLLSKNATIDEMKTRRAETVIKLAERFGSKELLAAVKTEIQRRKEIAEALKKKGFKPKAKKRPGRKPPKKMLKKKEEEVDQDPRIVATRPFQLPAMGYGSVINGISQLQQESLSRKAAKTEDITYYVNKESNAAFAYVHPEFQK
ncbi:hypothetical protein SNEBB_003522 [Seison nebaliae]|nr:hypothetical protein SNEBB_003522 [Seison nebaliae]